MCTGTGRPRILRIAAGLFTSGMMSGCATIGLLDVSDPDHRTMRTAEWTIQSLDAAYVNAEQTLLVCLTGRAPRTARHSPYSFLVSLDSHMDAHPAPCLRQGDRVDETLPAPRRIARTTVKPRDIYAGWPDAGTLAAQGWTRVPVRRSKPCSSACPDGCHARDPPFENAELGTVTYPVCEDACAAFVFASPGFVPVAVQPEPFRYTGPSLYALRIFLPVAVAFDAVTAPIQGIALLYVISNMKFF